MLGSLVFVLGLAVSSASVFETVYRAGVSYLAPDKDTEVRLLIPNNQCSGRIPLQEFGCISWIGVLIPPMVLEVKVEDNDGIPKVQISDRLDLVDVVRSGHCKGPAVVTIRKRCPFQDDKKNKQLLKRNARFDEHKLKGLRVLKPIMSRAI